MRSTRSGRPTKGLRMRHTKLIAASVVACATTLAVASKAWAQPDQAPAPTTADLALRVADLEAYVTNGAPKTLVSSGPGHNAWMMTSSALVLFMTLPGLALFYGGLVRRKNVLSVMAQCLGCAGFVTILWWLVGYSLAFDSGSPLLGGLHFALLKGVGAAPNANYGAWVSHSVFAMYQLMFAIITPALIVGAIAERMKYSALMAFLVGWMFVVYFPLAHMVWGHRRADERRLQRQRGIRAIDLAGGTVVHMAVRLVGPRALPDPGQAQGLRAACLLPAQPRLDHDRDGHALGRLAWVQRQGALSQPTASPRVLSWRRRSATAAACVTSAWASNGDARQADGPRALLNRRGRFRWSSCLLPVSSPPGVR